MVYDSVPAIIREHVLWYRHLNLQYFKIYRVSQEECARLREGVPYVKVYR